MKVKGQLEDAQFDNQATDPTNLPEGLSWLNTATGKLKTVIAATKRVFVFEDSTQTLTNKTLTSPVITTPTGITKSDVGLGNVDNTSDATKNAASATLTNKTLTTPVINSPTGLVKADVGLSNVDNTSDANKPVSTAQAAADALKANLAGGNTFTGTQNFSNDIVSSGYIKRSNANSITAFAGGGQASATLLSKELNDVSGVSAGDSVKLPAAVAGTYVYVNNTGVSSVSVYPASGEFIGTLGTNNPCTLNYATNVTFICSSTGSWRTISAGGSSTSAGGINYISNSDAEGGTTGWFTYDDSKSVTVTIASPCVGTVNSTSKFYLGMPFTFGQDISGTPPTGITLGTTYYISAIPSGTTFRFSTSVGGSDVNTSGTQSGNFLFKPSVPLTGTTNPTVNSGLLYSSNTNIILRGTKSFEYRKGPANNMGEGVSYDFTIDTADQAKVLNISFDYAEYLGPLYIDDVMQVWIYDITNGTLIQPSNFKVKAQRGTAAQFTATFQSASNSTSYRLCVHIASSYSSGFRMMLDKITVAPSNYVYGSPVTDLGSIVTTTTGSWVSNTTYTNKLGRDGDRLVGSIHLALTGAPTSATLTINLPFTIDTNKLAGGTASNQDLGEVNIVSGGVGYFGKLRYNTTTSVTVIAIGSGSTFSPVTQAFPATFANGDSVSCTAINIPIVGWSSSVQMSDSADTRVVAARFSTSSTRTMNNSGPTIVYENTVLDTHGAYNSSTGAYTIPVSGNYNIQGFFLTAGVAQSGISNEVGLMIYKNGSLISNLAGTRSATTSTSNYESSGSSTLPLIAGDVLTFRGYAETATTTVGSQPAANFISLFRLSGPSAISATESVNARYTTSAGQSIPNNTATTIVFGTKDFDSHNGMNAATGVYTVQVPGKYKVASALLTASAAWTAGSPVFTGVYKNGVEYARIGYHRIEANITTNMNPNNQPATVNCLAGDTLEIKFSQGQGGSVSLDPTAVLNWVSIERVGN